MTRKNAIKNVVGLLIIVGIVFWVRSCLPPSQGSVVKRFERHRESLEKILAMLAADPNITSVATYGVSEGHGYAQPEEIGFSRQRYLEYRALLKKVGATYVTRYDDETRFLIDSSGFAGYGWRLAIVHRDNVPANIIRELRQFRPNASSTTPNRAYCPIADNWYIWICW